MASQASLKRKHKTLNIEDKLQILEKLKKGESGASLAREFGVGKSTITDIKSKQDAIFKYTSQQDSNEGPKNRKTLKLATNMALEDALYLWFTQRRSLGEPISGPLLCEKALDFNKQVNGPPDFKASGGWLSNFKQRHGIRQLDVQGEMLSGDSAAAESFLKTFENITLDKQLSRDDVYNADETGINWRSLPRKSLASRNETRAPGYKVSKDRVTAMVCANASGTHSLPLLLIGKSKKPRCFKNVTCLPIIYRAQKSSWMTSDIFLDWYSNTFIPEVKKFRESQGKTGKVMLIIDNAPTHPDIDRLNSIDNNFTVMFLPPNVTALLQPMDQGVIAKMKKMYRKEVLRRLLLADRNEESVIEFTKKINLKDCCYMLDDSWKSLTEGNLMKAWNNLWPRPAINEDENNEGPEPELLGEIADLCNAIPGFEECDLADATEWLNSDINEHGYQIYNENEILSLVTEVNEPEDSSDDEDAIDSGPSHGDAFSALETAMNWYEKQPECCLPQLITLKKIRDLAAKKRSLTLVQKKMSDYFSKL